MDPDDLQLASEFCKLVQSSDLLEYLGLPADCAAEEVSQALSAKRRYMQAMQANPKYRDSARSLLKHHRAFARLLADPATYLEQVHSERVAEKLPLLEMVIDGILADGKVTEEEEAFLVQSGAAIGLSAEKVDELLERRAEEVGVQRTGHLSLAGALTFDGTETRQDADREVQGAEGYGWWDASFTRLLLETIPGGPGEMVDIYCRTGLSAVTLLPQRQQLSWMGIDRKPERLQAAGRALRGMGARVELAHGKPHSLPISNQSTDYVLSIRALANHPDPDRVFAEAVRVLRSGGRMVVAEPDGLAESFYFDGHLAGYNAAFHALCRRLDAAWGQGRSSITLGPELSVRLSKHGLRPTRVSVHTSSTFKRRPFSRLARRLRQYPVALVRAAGLPADGDEIIEVLAAVDRLERRIPAATEGMAGHVLPMFLCVGVKG